MEKSNSFQPSDSMRTENIMKITQIFAEHEVTISFEVFPPKTDDRYATVEKAACEIAALHPSFMSVTYGAGGGTSQNTASIAADIQDKFHTPVLAHLTCVSSTREHVRNMVNIYKEKGIENIMALRGDIPKEGRSIFEYNHACELIHDFLYRIREAGINVPVLPGIMPITNRKQVARSVALSGSTVPQRFRMMVDRFGDDPAKMKQAGVIYATEQIIDLISNGVTHIHVYSMNKPDIAAGIMQSLDAIWDHSFTQKNKF